MANAVALREFQFQGEPVRCDASSKDPWFVAKDVCQALDIPWRGNTLDSIKPEWRAMRSFRTPRRNPDGTIGFQTQEVVVISEAAVYKLAFRSRKPAAEAFTDWVASDVLPAIRKHGEYRSTQRRRYESQGKQINWIDEREEGIEIRKTFTGTLQDHDCLEFANATNAIYRPVLGGSASAVKARMQLPQKANLRDSLSSRDLMRVKFAEAMAADKIENENLRGNDPCISAATLAAKAVANALQVVRDTRV